MPQWLIIGISGVTCGGKTTLANKLRKYFLNQRNVQLWNTPYTICDVRLISQDNYFLPVDDLRHTWIESLNAINFELITSLDMKQMVSEITMIIKGHYLANDSTDYTDSSNDKSQYNGTAERFQPTQNQQIDNSFEEGYRDPNLNNLQNSTKTQHFQHHIQNQQLQHCHKYQIHSNNINNPNHHPTAHIMRVNSQAMPQIRDNKINILIIEGFMIFNQPELLSLCNMKFHFHLPYEKCFERRRKRTYDPPDVTGYFEMCVWPHYQKNFMEFQDRKDITFLNGDMSKEKIFKFVLQRIIQYFEERCDVACPPPQKFLGIPSCNNANTNSNTKLQSYPMEQQ